MPKQTDELRPTPAMLIADLKALGGYHVPWYEVEGAHIASVLRAALKQGVEITKDGGLRLKESGGSFVTKGPGLMLVGGDHPTDEIVTIKPMDDRAADESTETEKE
jgi:uncharacterized protein YodC (DUF2158 family)